jgi:CHAD domain-containing protein
MKELLERESKWDVNDLFVLPRLDDIVAGGTVVHSTVKLTSTYYDTIDRDLQIHGVTLRRREGSEKSERGWHLKVPNADGRIEIHAKASETLPADLADLLTGIRLGKELVKLATVFTVRDRYRLTDPRSRQLFAEVTDDHVSATGEGRHTTWREVEVELGPAASTTPRQLVKRLTRAGAKPSRYPSKLARVAPGHPTRRITSRSGRAFADYVTAQIDAIFDGDLGLRRRKDVIHDTRVAIRRLRSTLRLFGKLLDPSVVGDMESELKWFAGVLGDVRDCQVQRRRFAEGLAQLPPELVLGSVAARINSELLSIELPARERLDDALDSPRYLQILLILQRWRAQMPFAMPPTAAALNKYARRGERKADRRLAEAIQADSQGNGDAPLHRARKAAKRARYAAELLAPLEGKRARRTIKRYKNIQTVLGDFQDSVVARATLRRLANEGGTTQGENGFTYGLLHAREDEVARTARAAVRDVA